MTESENEKIIGKIVELANLRKLDEMLEYFTDDATAQVNGGEKPDKKGLREDYAGIPATGKRVEMVAVWIVDFKDGKVKVFKVFYNPDMAVQQLQE